MLCERVVSTSNVIKRCAAIMKLQGVLWENSVCPDWFYMGCFVCGHILIIDAIKVK